MFDIVIMLFGWLPPILQILFIGITVLFVIIVIIRLVILILDLIPIL